MLDNKKEVVNALSQILPTYYEFICNSATMKPCITYTENSNIDDIKSMESGYSRIQYTVKIWVDGVEVKAITEYAEQVDIAMRNLGFSRVSNIELVVGGQIEKVLIYEALGKEIYK